MGEEESKKVEFERDVVVIPSPSPSPSPPSRSQSGKDHSHIKEREPYHDPSDENFLVPLLVQDVASPRTPPISENTALAKVETEKRLALVKAWEESEKTKADNKAYKKLSAIGAWENTKKAAIVAELTQIQEQIEKEKAVKVEKMKNKMAKIHKAAEERRASVEAKRGEDFLKVEEVASKFRTTGTTPMKLFKCFGF